MTRFLLDQGLPRSSAAALRARGVDALHAAEAGLSRATDQVILQYAADHERVVVTLDADFHLILAMQEADKPSVVRIRVEGLGGADIAALILDVDATVARSLAEGAAVSITHNDIRIHRLPFTKND